LVKNKLFRVILSLLILFSVFSGTAVLPQAAGYPVGNEIFTSKDLTFDTLPVGSPPPESWGFGSAYQVGTVTVGGANNTANYLDVPAAWNVFGIQEQTGYLSGGKNYRLSFWMRGSKPLTMKISIWTGVAVEYDVLPTITSLSLITWKKYNYDFTAPAGAGDGVRDANGHFFLNVQSHQTGFQIDEISLKELSTVPTPIPTPTPVPTPSPVPTPTPTPDPNAPPKIMCIGDSITQGTAGFGSVLQELSYRYSLWKILIDQNKKFEFVGTRTTGFNTTPNYASYNGFTFSNKQEGYWGWTTQAVRDVLTEPLQIITPDIAIIYLGTNGSETATQKTAYMKTLIEKLRLTNPKIKVLLGKPYQSGLTDLQSNYGALATEMNTVTSPVIAVPVPSGWVDDPAAANSCTNDWAHTNVTGDQKLANTIYPVLAPFLSNNANTPVPTATPSSSPSATPTLLPSITPVLTSSPTPSMSPTVTSTPIIPATPTPTPTPTSSPCIQTPPVLKLVCIGDSITHGNGQPNENGKTFTSYRYPLWMKFVANSAKVEFVGSRSGNFNKDCVFKTLKGQTFNNKHIAQYGITISAMNTVLQDELGTIRFDAAIIMLGTNNEPDEAKMTAEDYANAKANKMRTLIQTIRSKNPAATIFIGELYQPNLEIVNEKYRALATELNSTQSPVTCVRTGSDDWNTTEHQIDGAHPSNKGDEIIATNWYRALSAQLPYFVPVIPSAPVINAVTNKATTISGKADIGSVLSITIGTRKYVQSNPKKNFSVQLLRAFVAGTKVTVYVTLKNIKSKITTTYVVPFTPVVQAVKTNDTKVTGQATKGSVVTVKFGQTTYRSKADLKGAFSIKIPIVKKGNLISVRSFANGRWSAYKICRVL